jgi:hypothetical protein
MMPTVPLSDIPILMRLTAAFRRAVSGLEGGGAIVRKLVLKVRSSMFLSLPLSQHLKGLDIPRR